MTSKSISFIVPCYCTSRDLLLRCLRSVMSLPVGLDWEIVLIDDGTPDSHVKEWVDELNEERIHYHYQSNAGLGQARNVGVEKSQKEYVHFLDSDDYIFPDEFSKCLDLVENSDADLLMFEFRDVFTDGVEKFQSGKKEVECDINGVDYILQNSMIGAVWNMIIKRSLLDNLKFTANLFHEDEEYKPLLLLRAKNMVVTNLKPYAYYHHSASIIGNVEESKLERRFCDMLYVVDSLRRHCENLKGKERLAIEKRIAQLCEMMLYNAMRLSPNKAFFRKWFGRLKEKGIYPFPKRNYNFNYKLFRFATNADWKVGIIYKILNRR